MNINDEKNVTFNRKLWKNDLCNLYFTKINEMRKPNKRFEVVKDPE